MSADEYGSDGRAEYSVGDNDSLTFARRFTAPDDAFSVYRSHFAESWGFDYDVTDMEGQPRGLVWVESGMMTAHAGRERWTLGPDVAIWFPKDVASDVIPNLPSRAFYLQFETPSGSFDPPQPTLLRMTPLGKQLLLRLGAADCSVDAAFLAKELLLREMVPLPTGLHTLTLPVDRRVRSVAARILADPADRSTLAEYAEAVFCSTKTLQRAFVAETGLGFRQWRRIARVLASLPLLESDVPVTLAASRVGFSDPGAFIDAFRHHFGSTPGEYSRNVRSASPPRGQG